MRQLSPEGQEHVRSGKNLADLSREDRLALREQLQDASYTMSAAQREARRLFPHKHDRAYVYAQLEKMPAIAEATKRILNAMVRHANNRS